ncbi:UDP-glucose dehydrogenase family protein [Aquibaculum arenosum]|uniref:UDP-glucose 6-dehydrogenase n=1 Tax=Aquibaculum arenosum TaxID=3032591 RepID=A0ABT5YHT3_9PROT|nr:UDP-glucose/GDP-mannose dehydrogenase family protein [Fodinicurvata sp. CAU 1616]MDF2094477.1 UDP-glucose/GDP-mannose dehydrogenase family protein [Fodinicurvata sp. CAU 1616]
MQLKVTIVGAGYVGLVSAACFAHLGTSVTCVDRDRSRIDRLEQGESPIFEEGLDELILEGQQRGLLHFSTDLAAKVADADLIFIAVGTPSSKGDGYPDMAQVEAVARAIAPVLSGYTVLVTKSTVPAGTGRWLETLLRELRPDADVDVASNPEFLREGCAIRDFLEPDRVVLGADNERARDHLQALYRPLADRAVPVVMTTRETAELIKYAGNAFLATKITFINEMADLCEKFDADVEVLARGIGLDRRIGPLFLKAGPGYGGSCFPKDTRGLITIAERAGAPTRLVEAVNSINEDRKASMAERIRGLLGGSLEGITLAVLGVTFKAGTDDMREAPSLDILPRLQAAGAAIQAYDPAGMEHAENLLPGVSWHEDAYDAATGADALVILTEWSQFKALDLLRMRETLGQPMVIDLRNLYEPQVMRDAGFVYHSVGRGSRTKFIERSLGVVSSDAAE